MSSLVLVVLGSVNTCVLQVRHPHSCKWRLTKGKQRRQTREKHLSSCPPPQAPSQGFCCSFCPCWGWVKFNTTASQISGPHCCLGLIGHCGNVEADKNPNILFPAEPSLKLLSEVNLYMYSLLVGPWVVCESKGLLL